MPKLIFAPTRVQAVGNKPKQIDEHIGRANSGDRRLSVAVMKSPEGWEEPGQTPDFDEYTVVLKGRLVVKYEGGSMDVKAGQAVICESGDWVQYSTPDPEGAEYIAICMPAYSMESVHRDKVVVAD